MNLSDSDIQELREAVKARLSEQRYLHTLGVEAAALKIGEYCMPEALGELRVAALLHDVAKEIPLTEQMEILSALDDVTEDDLLSPPIFHSLTAPFVAKRDFSRFLTERILSALKNHTTGAPDMSVFDQIIFIADFVEDTRVYTACAKAREKLYSALSAAKDAEQCISILHLSVIETLDFTIKYLIDKGKYLNGRTVATRNAFLGRFPVALDKE